MGLPAHARYRLASIGLAAVLLCLAGFAVWAATTTKSAGESLERTTELSEAYGRARAALGAEREIVTGYASGGGALGAGTGEVAARHDAAAARVTKALDEARVYAEGRRRAEVEDLLRRHRAYVDEAIRLLTAGQRGDRATVVDLSRSAEPALGGMIRETGRLARAYRDGSTRELGSVRRSGDVVFAGTVIAFSVGFALLGLFGSVMRSYRLRLDRARQAEIDRLARAALVDGLTDLRNHRAFQEDLARELERRSRSGVTFSVAMLDLDDFRRLNETRGHEAGDERLKAVARDLVKTSRASDAPYRIGADQFAVILSGAPAAGALRFVERLRENVGGAPHGRFRAGVVEADDGVGREVLVRRAEQALAEARDGEDRTVVFEPEEAEPGAAVPLAPGESPAERKRVETLAGALAGAVDRREPAARSHTQTVAELAARMARELGLDPHRTQRLHRAGLLHDVGMVGIPDSILEKPGGLTRDEFAAMKEHVSVGQRIALGAGLDEEAEWILHHHERPDGRGYPSGLRGAEIPLEARILAVADAYEAMTADRPWRRAAAPAEALDELERCAGAQFDADCVAALRRALGAGSERPPAERAGQPATV